MQFLGKRYLSAREVCERYSISLRTLNRRTLADDFPPHLKLQERRFWLEDDLVAWEGRTVARAMTQGRSEGVAA